MTISSSMKRGSLRRKIGKKLQFGFSLVGGWFALDSSFTGLAYFDLFFSFFSSFPSPDSDKSFILENSWKILTNLFFFPFFFSVTCLFEGRFFCFWIKDSFFFFFWQNSGLTRWSVPLRSFDENIFLVTRSGLVGGFFKLEILFYTLRKCSLFFFIFRGSIFCRSAFLNNVVDQTFFSESSSSFQWKTMWCALRLLGIQK